jgi:DNA-binding NarL/FixJ family response regulator
MSSMSPASAHPGPDSFGKPADLAHALEAITRIHLAIDPPQLLERLMRATTAIGATASIYTLTIPESGTEPSSFSLFACHPALAQRQYRLGPLSNHPWFRCARERSAPATEHQVRLTSASDAEAIDLARQYGFRSCLIVPTTSTAEPERLEMLCLGSTDERAFEGEEASIVRTLARALAAELHDWVNRHLRESLQETAGLRTPDIELLKLELQGLGSKEIALKTGMTPTSVDSRFQRINARLACANRKASARRAAAYGLLEAR